MELDKLTNRQQEIVALVAKGLTDVEIAREMVISLATASTHVKSARQRLGFHTRVELAVWYTKQTVDEWRDDGSTRTE
jgi:DNA-binding NarL/FixJ family response regulator